MNVIQRFPKEKNKNSQTYFVLLFFLSLCFFLAANMIPIPAADEKKEDMVRASRYMAQAVNVLDECRNVQNHVPGKLMDSDSDALIGVEYSEITTSIGQLEAKRTTLNPNFAALIVLWLKEAGVSQGDTIAVGASASFPALIVAVFSACRSLNLRPLAIISLGASQWGANDPDFHWLRMQECLVRSGILNYKPIAVSLGGGKDVGEDLTPGGLALLQRAIAESGILPLYEPDLERNVDLRMKAYEDAARGERLRAFINIGGSYANMGIDSKILEVEPGLARIQEYPTAEKRGIIFTMAQRQVPVIHLLYIKGIAAKYGIPWNPRTAPVPGKGGFYTRIREKTVSFLSIGVIYLVIISGILLFRKAF